MGLKKMIIAGVFLIALKVSQAQNVYFNFSDGTTATFAMEEMRKVDFNADVMNVYLWNGSVYAWNVSVINSFEPEPNPAGVEDVQPAFNAMDILLFPNPSGGDVLLRYNLPKEDEIHYALFDAGGKLITESKLGIQAAGDYQQMLDLSNCAAGNYFLRFSGKNSTISKVLIKN